jgi:hypothetical protein
MGELMRDQEQEEAEHEGSVARSARERE